MSSASPAARSRSPLSTPKLSLESDDDARSPAKAAGDKTGKKITARAAVKRAAPARAKTAATTNGSAPAAVVAKNPLAVARLPVPKAHSESAGSVKPTSQSKGLPAAIVGGLLCVAENCGMYHVTCSMAAFNVTELTRFVALQMLLLYQSDCHRQ